MFEESLFEYDNQPFYGDVMKNDYWFDENFKNICRFGLKARRPLYKARSPFQQIDIFETESFGRVLVIDGMFMTSERDEYLYHEMLIHPAMTTSPSIKRVLIIGGGDGGSAREVLSYPEVESVLLVEIDQMVVEACQQFLPNIGTAWDDPRLEVRFADGIEFVKTAEVEPFDVIILDGSDPVGPAEGLFSEDFYRSCARVLSENGVFALQSESPFIQRETFLQLSATLGRIFERVHPYFGSVPIYASGMWSWTFASRHVNPKEFDEVRMARQEERCKQFNRNIHSACFAVPNSLRNVFVDGKVRL